MKKVTKLRPGIQAVIKKKRVAAYCRVSFHSERLEHSLAAQTSYYNSLISRNPEWEFAGIFSDDGKTGTLISKRPGFQEMIESAMNGGIDIILTKSVTRFARNTVDLLDTVRKLKSRGVEVRFEKENISSMTGDGELMLSILASFAQEESRSVSQNIKWGIQKKFKSGRPHILFRIYGYRWVDGILKPEPAEAETVRRIFREWTEGKSASLIASELNEEKIFNRDGNPWTSSGILYVLSNITYTGNLLLQKEFRTDPISKKKKKNEGELEQIYVESSHEAIVSLEQFEAAQSQRNCWKPEGCSRKQSLVTSKTREDHIPYKKIMRCKNCGAPMRVNLSYSGSGAPVMTVLCPNGVRRKESPCHSVRINSKLVDAIGSVVLQKPGICSDNLEEHFQQIQVSADRKLEMTLMNGNKEKFDFSGLVGKNISKFLKENLHA